MLASVPSSETWAWQVPPEMREAAAARAGSWRLTTWEHEPREGWLWDEDRLVCVEIILTENELNALNATARQNIAASAKEQVLRGSMEQTAARLWRTGDLADTALRSLAPEMVLRWVRGGQVKHAGWLTVCCGYDKKRFRTECRWLGTPSMTKRKHFSLRYLFGFGGGASPDPVGGPSEHTPVEEVETVDEPECADPTVNEEAERRILRQELGVITERDEEQEALTFAESHGRYRVIRLYYPWRMLKWAWDPPDAPSEVIRGGSLPVLAVIGQDYDKSKPKIRAPIVGVVVAPCSELPNVYTNSLDNVESAIEERMTKKRRPCTWTKHDKAKVGAFVRASMSAKGMFSEGRIRG